MITPTLGAGAQKVTCVTKNGPCIDCEFWGTAKIGCEIKKSPDENLDCVFYAKKE